MNRFKQIPVVALKTLTHCVMIIVMNTDAVGWTRSTRNNPTGGLSQIRIKWATCRVIKDFIIKSWIYVRTERDSN